MQIVMRRHGHLKCRRLLGRYASYLGRTRQINYSQCTGDIACPSIKLKLGCMLCRRRDTGIVVPKQPCERSHMKRLRGKDRSCPRKSSMVSFLSILLKWSQGFRGVQKKHQMALHHRIEHLLLFALVNNKFTFHYRWWQLLNLVELSVSGLV
ncbi:hypothetical protein BJV82DRAFT_257545 [Fennellomyces sp. T-0311]|nr:hypothetical protein BJV82DRAFT_257545 [Fennellomyces sp. T-0311]